MSKLIPPFRGTLVFCLLFVASCSTEETSSQSSELIGVGPQTPAVMTYDALGRLSSVEYKGSTKRVRFAYDANGNRTTRIVDATITNLNPVVP